MEVASPLRGTGPERRTCREAGTALRFDPTIWAQRSTWGWRRRMADGSVAVPCRWEQRFIPHGIGSSK